VANKANKDIGAALFEEGRGHMRPFAYDLADANAGTLQRKLRNTIQRKQIEQTAKAHVKSAHSSANKFRAQGQCAT